ncbi:methyltransferase [Clostridium sp. PL3]|uniref:Methyltransferase n=1 Tax=Clostridium thailandense TaxID=2794346 RepID=A0A949TJF7_9CLOT|nr:uroporphyrinogen decarboxylase family protein [Clostridium thailandense]MBV7273954.1 methyltransferase [Clostridium thailandense]
MNSRERVLSSLNHREPDGLAVDLGSNPSSGISAIAHSRLVNKLELKNRKTKVFDVVQQVAQPEMELVDALNLDVLDIGRVFNVNDTDWYDFTLYDGTVVQYPTWFKPDRHPDGSYTCSKHGKIIAKMPYGATFFDQTVFPYIDGYPENYKDLSEAMNVVLWQALVHSPWDHAAEDNFWEVLRERTLELRKNTDKALMITCGCNLFEWGTFLRKIDNFLMDILLEPEEIEKLVEALMEKHLASLKNVCEAVGDIVDIIRFGDDLGMDSGPFMAPDLYRKLFKPHHTILNAYVHKHSNMKTFLHSCGSIYKVIPDLIEAGYDIINPVQTVAKDMEPERLKKEFGKDITFWGGGCDTRKILNHAKPEEIKDHVRRNIEILAPGGGFIFNPVHNIMPDVPPENVIAMFEAVNEYR